MITRSFISNVYLYFSLELSALIAHLEQIFTVLTLPLLIYTYDPIYETMENYTHLFFSRFKYVC